MDIRGKRLLRVGGAGLIGSHTVDDLLLEDVAEVRVYDNFTRGSRENLEQALRDPRVRIFEAGGDILHRDVLEAAMQGIDGVFHFAALWLLHCHDYPRSAFDVNIAGTFNVAEACLRTGVRRLVFSSSASVYGDAVEEPMTEEHPYNNRTFYGATKIAGEQILRALYERYGREKGSSYVGLRYMNVYGPRQDYRGAYVAVMMKMLDRIDEGMPPVVYGDGSQAYDFVYVGDCGRANVLAMKADATDAFYNVGTGVKTTVKETAELVLELTGARTGIRYEPAGPTFVRNRVGSTAKAAAELQFRAEMPLRDGLRRLIEWRRAHQDAVAQRREQASTRS
jgi:UDP-glucose 4-epimerase